jgi:tripartite motif-containing protein 71
MGVAVATNGNVYVADCGNNRIQYFTATGSFLGEFGSARFDRSWGVAVSSDAARVYGVDFGNHRVQYFEQTNPGVAPASPGKVKALFK